MRISNSFSAGEVQVMEFILKTLLRGGTPTMAVRNKDFPSLYRKVMTMKQRLADKAEKREREELKESAVGTIRAPELDGIEDDGLQEKLG